MWAGRPARAPNQCLALGWDQGVNLPRDLELWGLVADIIDDLKAGWGLGRMPWVSATIPILCQHRVLSHIYSFTAVFLSF